MLLSWTLLQLLPHVRLGFLVLPVLPLVGLWVDP